MTSMGSHEKRQTFLSGFFHTHGALARKPGLLRCKSGSVSRNGVLEKFTFARTSERRSKATQPPEPSIFTSVIPEVPCYTHIMNIVFLDRDGTVIAEPEDRRVDDPSKIELFSDSIQALKYLADNGFSAVLITNQAGIEEGRISEDEFWQLHEQVLDRLKPSGLRILKTYFNPEAERPGNSEYRKPGPGMLLQAASDLQIDISDVYMVGDSESDIQAALRAGCKGGVFLKTTDPNASSTDAVFNARSLLDAAKFIIANS